MTSDWTKEEAPAGDLMAAIRLGFIRKGTTYTAWCKKHSVNPSNARVAIQGGYRGPRAMQLVNRIKKAAGVQ